MAKKKRSPKKKQASSKRKQASSKKKQASSQKSKPRGGKAQKTSPERQSLGKVIQRLLVFILVTTGLFYVVLNFAVGGNALWKVFVVAAIPYAYLAMRRQFFEAPGFFALLRPTLSNLLLGLGVFVLANGLGFLLFRFGIQGTPSNETLARMLQGTLFVISPVLAFSVKLKATSWASFAALDSSFQLSLTLSSLLYYYGCITLVHLEKDHDLAEQAPLHMLQV